MTYLRRALSVARRSARAAFTRLTTSKKAVFGAAVVLCFILVGLLAPVIAPGNPLAVVGPQNLAPSAQHLLGTTGEGNDVFAQVVWGTRNSLAVGFLTGATIAIIGVAIGLSAAFFGGWADNVLTLLMNVFLVIPGLPLLVVMAAFLPRTTLSVSFVLAIAGWAGSARVIRSQALSVVKRDYVAAATVIGERPLRIIVMEVLPSLSSLIASALFGAIGYGIGSLAALQFLGLGDLTTVSWGTILYWAQNNSSLLQGTWWQFVPAGACLALTCAAISMLNFAIDEVTNPRLRTIRERGVRLVRRARRARQEEPHAA
ncbi:MAG TPA: ABC transporter permease [Streptosporangiaceae bacterium]|nr:ABC transporter permease [Streptosporangiaceae bacterium]